MADAGRKRKRPARPTTPKEDRFPADFDNGGQWYCFQNTDCARGLNAGQFTYEDEEEAVKKAKATCSNNKWAGFTNAKEWKTIYFKFAAHSLQADFKYPCPENPAKSVDTYMYLTEEGFATWKQRTEEFQEWKNKEEHKNLAYEEFEKGASWWCDFRREPAYQQQGDASEE